jgi:hypothetical protein
MPGRKRHTDPKDPPTERLPALDAALDVVDKSFDTTAPDRRDWVPNDYRPK